MTDSSEANLFRKLEEEVLGSKPTTEPHKNVQSWSTINYFKRKVSRKSSKITVKRERLMKNALDVPLIVLQTTKKWTWAETLASEWTLLTYTDREILKSSM